ncbi:DegT/DnrJ/EryC1/StrS family aminotransferase [Victivallaceae bacterium BBE-744-WT-12]|uniref:DegT/DnrJ/EryC1/StrS family aminotransferase n=1 Tax=Victivallis lenta TaxID=2606640 RepID=A0A844G2T3_9BACT|nr:DegT/DnrJ/EryC1/StrS family aminotransferase [Victivallis lenta]MST96848.1 DegT/DnrJ/EryC1/StrS family aminotransferase [Victivallis lenta]
MQFIDLHTQYKRHEETIDKAVKRVLEDGHYIGGREVGELESTLAAFVGRRHAIACANGTDALKIVLMAKGIGPGDAVFTTPFTFFATAEVVGNLGATPVFVDIDEKTYNIDPAKLDEAIGKVKKAGTLVPRAVIPVDLFGQIAAFEAIVPVAEKHGLWLLEDAAQSFGAQRGGRRSCSFGLASTTSFFPAKPLGCYGDGGMIFTDDDELAVLCRSVAVHGKGRDKYDNVRLGLNSRLDTIQAAILLEKFKIFPAELEARDEAARRYSTWLSGKVTTPFIEPGCCSAWAQYCVRSPRRGEMMAALKTEKIPTAVYYPVPLHKVTAFSYLSPVTLPVSEAVAQDIFALPMHPYLEVSEQKKIADVITSC